MACIELPKFDVDDVEVLIAEEIPICIDLWLILDIIEAFQDIGPPKLPKCHLIIVLLVGHVEHSIDHAQRVEVLKLRGGFQEFKPRVHFHHHFEELLEVLQRQVFFVGP